MAESEAVVTNQTIIKRGDGASPEVFTKVPGVFNISPPTQSRPKIDTSALDDVADRHKVGRLSNGDLSIQYHWIPGNAVQEALYEDFYAGTLRNFRIYYPDDDGVAEGGGFDAFSAHVLSISRDAIDSNGRIVRTVTLAVDGEFTDTDT